MADKTPVLLDGVRTPIGRWAGALAEVRPDDMAALTIEKVVERTGVEPSDIEDVLLGNANGAGEENRNVARMSLLLADLPIEVAGQTINRLCASGMQTIATAANSVRVGQGDVFVAGGVESMTRAPFVVAKNDQAWGRKAEMHDTSIGWRFVNPDLADKYHPYSMGETAENVVERYDLSREEQDDFAYNSQMKWKEAHEAGKFDNEVIPVEIPQRKGEPEVVDTDEHPRPNLDREKLDRLPAVFREGGSVTPGNASGINDGAAATVVSSQEYAEEHGHEPLARIVTSAVAGVEPSCMGLGPIPASEKALDRAGLETADIDLVEINEAFAAQSIPCLRELGFRDRMDIVNVNGGAIAIGHPLGMSGTRITLTLCKELERRGDRWGLATMCIGVGQGMAVVVENLRR